jgi:hypothetical protein
MKHRLNFHSSFVCLNIALQHISPVTYITLEKRAGMHVDFLVKKLVFIPFYEKLYLSTTNQLLIAWRSVYYFSVCYLRTDEQSLLEAKISLPGCGKPGQEFRISNIFCLFRTLTKISIYFTFKVFSTGCLKFLYHYLSNFPIAVASTFLPLILLHSFIKSACSSP